VLVPLPFLQPLPLTRRTEPFYHQDWLFEKNYDGFRSLTAIHLGALREFRWLRRRRSLS
jgi:ATP-dependent DNA ligase